MVLIQDGDISVSQLLSHAQCPRLLQHRVEVLQHVAKIARFATQSKYMTEILGTGILMRYPFNSAFSMKHQAAFHS